MHATRRAVALILLAASRAAASNAEGTAFLEENKNKEGVITLASGMQYKVLRTGDGEPPSTARPNRASP